MVDRDERVGLLARYLAAWRASEHAQWAYDACEAHLFGIDAVRALDARDDLMGAGIVTREETAGWRLPIDRDRPPTPEQHVEATRLAAEATRAEEAADEVLLAVRAAMAQDGYPVGDGLMFDELLAWAGVDLAGLERAIHAYSTAPAARDSDALATVVGSPENEARG